MTPAFKYDVRDRVSFTLHVLDSFQCTMTGVVEEQLIVKDEPSYNILCDDGCVRERREKDLDS